MGPAERAAFSPDGQRVVIFKESGSAPVLKGRGPATAGGVSLDLGVPVRFALFSGDGRRIVTAGSNRVRVWEAESGRPVAPAVALAHSLPNTMNTSTTGSTVSSNDLPVQLSRDGRRLAALDDKAQVRVYALSTGSLLFDPITDLTAREPATDPSEGAGAARSRQVVGYRLSPDGRMLAFAMNFVRGGVVHLYHLDTKRSLRFSSPHGFVRCLDFSDDGRRLLVAATDMSVRTWDTETGLAIGPSLRQHVMPHLAAFSMDGRRIALHDSSGTLSLWDCESGDLLVPPFPGRVNSLQRIWFSRDGHSLVGQTGSGEAFQWDLPRLSGTREQLADVLRLLTAHEIHERDGIERLSRSTLRDDPDRFRDSWLAWRSAIEADSTPQPPSGSESRRWILSRIESGRRKVDALAKEVQQTGPADLEYLDRAIAEDPADYRLLLKRGEILARNRRWPEAARDYERAAPLAPPDIMNSLRCVALALTVGDEDQYRRVYRGMLERFGDTQATFEIGKVCKIALMKRATASEADRTTRIMEDLISSGQAQGLSAWFLGSLALADERAGDPARGLERLDRLRKMLGSGGSPAIEAWAAIVRALCHERLGRRGPALEALREAESLLRTNLWEHALPLDTEWHDWLLDQVLFREAEARIIKDPIFPDDPFAPAR
jgi:hypothetical protein